MGKVNGSGTNWSKHNGGDNAMSSDEFENFWKEEVEGNWEHRNDKMNASDEKTIRAHKDIYLKNDGNISESEFNILVSYCNTALDYTEGDIPSVPSSPGSKPETGASLKYTFDLTKLQDDLDILDVEDDGADDDLIDKEATINSYIDAFDKANLGIDPAEVERVKNSAKSMLEDGGTIDLNELKSLLLLMKKGQSKDSDISKNSFTFDPYVDFSDLDARDGTVDDKITISNKDLTDYIDAYQTANPGMSDKELTSVKKTAKTMIEDGGTIDLNELCTLVKLMQNGQSKDRDIEQNPFSFETLIDFHYLDAQDGTDDDIITISYDSLTTYIDAFNEAKPGMTSAELAQVKETAKTMLGDDGEIGQFGIYALLLLMQDFQSQTRI